MRYLGTTTVQALTDHWGHGPEDWGLPADTDPSSTVYVTETDDGGIRLEVEVAGQEHLPVHDRETRYIPSPDGGIDGFATADLPPGAINPGAYARMHYDADTAALGSGETLKASEPVAWLSGAESPPGDDDWQREVAQEYRRLRQRHDGRPRRA